MQNFNHEITAAVTMSGYAYPIEMLDEGAEAVLGSVLGKLFHPFVWCYHKLTFGSNAELNAVDGINHAGIPVLVIHGEQDETVNYEKVSILSKQKQIMNPNAEFYTITGTHSHHNDFFNSEPANVYIDAFNEVYKPLSEKYKDDIPEEILEELFSDVDKELVNTYNTDLLAMISDFYETALISPAN